jgi:hypothetical protein
MRRPHESSADRVWKEKLESCASPHEATIVLVLLMVVLFGGILVA